MKTVFLDTVGCKLNQSEIERFAVGFRAAGYELVANPNQADVVVINTCAVTAAAASDSRQKIRQAIRLDGKRVIATGCLSSLESDLMDQFPGLTLSIPNSEKQHLVLQVLEDPTEITGMVRSAIPGERSRTRAFIKAQDGCDNHCTFCVTRLARGSSRSESDEGIKAEIIAALGGNAKEIVLTGVQLGAWGRDMVPVRTFGSLIESILEIPHEFRLRISSVEPWDLSKDFFSLWKDHRLCRHIHLPIQSGCAKTLKRMGRRNTPESYRVLLEQLREQIPEAAVTTDMITGFPGETDAEHDESLRFLEDCHFAGGHVFPFSPRYGTPASKMGDRLPPATLKSRSMEARALLQHAGMDYARQWIGRSAAVLWEAAIPLNNGEWRISGLTDNYIRVRKTSRQVLENSVSVITLGELQSDGSLAALDA